MKRILEFSLLIFLINLLSFYAFANSELSSETQNTKICQIFDEGKTSLGWKKLRIVQGNRVIAGVDSLGEAVHEIDQLKSDGECTIQAQNCALASEGYAQGAWFRSVLMVGDQAVAGANDLGKLVTQFKQLKEKGICE